MDKLRTFYLRIARTYAVILAGIGITIGEKIIPFLNTQITEYPLMDFVIKFITSSIPFTLLYLGGEYIIRHYLWKLSFFYRDISIEGQWLGCSYYTNLEIEGNGVTKENFVKSNETHGVKIFQDCLEIKIEPSIGKIFANWASNAADLSGKVLKFSYEVFYSDEERLSKSDAKGYEEMSIIQYNKKGYPILMTGKFSHCANGSSPIYRGKTMFLKKEFINEIKIDNELTDEDFKNTIEKLKNGTN